MGNPDSTKGGGLVFKIHTHGLLSPRSQVRILSTSIKNMV